MGLALQREPNGVELEALLFGARTEKHLIASGIEHDALAGSRFQDAVSVAEDGDRRFIERIRHRRDEHRAFSEGHQRVVANELLAYGPGRPALIEIQPGGFRIHRGVSAQRRRIELRHRECRRAED